MLFKPLTLSHICLKFVLVRNVQIDLSDYVIQDSTITTALHMKLNFRKVDHHCMLSKANTQDFAFHINLNHRRTILLNLSIPVDLLYRIFARGPYFLLMISCTRESKSQYKSLHECDRHTIAPNELRALLTRLKIVPCQKNSPLSYHSKLLSHSCDTKNMRFNKFLLQSLRFVILFCVTNEPSS